MPNKKLCTASNGKVRGAFKASLFAFTTAMAINYGRIYRAISISTKISFIFALKFLIYIKKYLFGLPSNLRHSYFNIMGKNEYLKVENNINPKHAFQRGLIYTIEAKPTNLNGKGFNKTNKMLLVK